MGTIIVGGALAVVVALIIFNIIRKVRQGKSAFCSSSSCDCGCSAGMSCQSHQKPGKEDASSSSSCCCCGKAQDHLDGPGQQ